MQHMKNIQGAKDKRRLGCIAERDKSKSKYHSKTQSKVYTL